MSAPTLSAAAHLTAVKAAIAAQGVPVYGYGEVPGTNGNAGTVPANYVTVGVERRYLPANRVVGRTGRTAWRITARSISKAVSSVGAGNTYVAQNKVATALNQVRLTVAGDISTPVQHESSQAPDYDEGWYVQNSAYTYAC